MSTVTIPELQILYKRTSGGGVQIWHARVEPRDDGTAEIVVRYGLLNGKQVEQREHITAGKNIGKRNETSSLQQAIAEMTSKWDKQRDRKHYGLTIEESAGKRAEAPMLAKVYEKYARKVEWDSAFEQPKLDGYRCLADKVDGEILFWSREGQPFVLPHIAEALQSVLQDGDRLDGELYTHGISLNSIASLVKDPRAETSQLFYNVYDSPLPMPFDDRFGLVLSRLGPRRQVGNVVAVETVRVHSEEALLSMQATRIDEGYEGSMLRYGDLPYQAGKRADCLLKVKVWEDAEFLTTGVKEGRGTHAGMAIFQCVTERGHTFDCLAPGTHDEKRAAWDARERLVGQRLTIRYAYMTKTEQPVPWHPVALRFHTELTHGVAKR